jgi:hypothetical protein
VIDSRCLKLRKAKEERVLTVEGSLIIIKKTHEIKHDEPTH